MTMVRLDTWSQVIITIVALAQIGLLAGMAFIAYFLYSKAKSLSTEIVDDVLEKTLPRVQPTLDHVNDVTGKVSDLVERISPKVVQIADESEGTVHNVTEKVKTTSTLVTENVARPMVNIASLLTGVQRGLEVWKTAKDTQDGDGRAPAGTTEEVLVVTPETNER